MFIHVHLRRPAKVESCPSKQAFRCGEAEGVVAVAYALRVPESPKFEAFSQWGWLARDAEDPGPLLGSTSFATFRALSNGVIFLLLNERVSKPFVDHEGIQSSVVASDFTNDWCYCHEIMEVDVRTIPRDPHTFSEGTWTLQVYITGSPITFSEGIHWLCPGHF